jgi:hypothetical protein
MAFVYLDGSIDEQSVGNFESEMRRNNITSAYVSLNSLGGNVFAAIKLGCFFRKNGFMTSVGTPGGSLSESLPGQCYSACVFAFIGGYYRYLKSPSVIGVHRFSKRTISPDDVDTAQIVSGAITIYLKEMGVDIALFEMMSRIDKDEIQIIPQDLAIQYKIVNNGFLPASWSIEIFKTVLYLRGVQQAWYGIGKSIFICSEKSIILFEPVYQAGINSETIINRAVTHWLRVDESFLPLSTPIIPLRKSGDDYISAVFEFPSEYISILSTAKAVGYGAKPLNPIGFWGFTVDIENEHEKIVSFLNKCTNSAKKKKAGKRS